MKPFLLDLVEELSLDSRDRKLLFWSCSIDFRLSPVEVEARLMPPSFDGGLTMWPTAGVPGMVGSLSCSSLVGEDSESLVTATMSLYICSISGVIRPWLMVRLCLARKERRCRDSTRLRDMSSCEMQAFGDVSASGCGRVVLRPVGLVNKIIEDLTVGAETYYRRMAQESPSLGSEAAMCRCGAWKSCCWSPTCSSWSGEELDEVCGRKPFLFSLVPTR